MAGVWNADGQVNPTAPPAPPPPASAVPPPGPDYAADGKPGVWPAQADPPSQAQAPGPPPGIADFDVGVSENTSAEYVKRGLIIKVYTILSIMLAVTVGVASVALFVDPVTEFLADRLYFVYIGLALTIAAYVMLFCVKSSRALSACGLALLLAGQTIIVSAISAFYKSNGAGFIVFQVAITTMVIFLSLTIIAFVTRKNFNFLAGFLSAATLALIAIAVMTWVLGWVAGGRSRVLNFFISFLGTLILVGYILYDTSKIIHDYGPDDYVIAVVSLYTDVVQLFLCLLSIASCANSS